ncbi:MAG: hypothetical protein PHD43_13705 [Methylococcales bacterium]|nr:hypothetical protein [Methylococcales bacterium]
MINRNQLVITLTLTAIGLLGSTVKAEPQVGKAMRIIPMQWSKRSPEETAQRILYAANLVAGRTLDADLESVFLKEHDAFQKWSAPFKDAPELKIKVIPAYDEIRILNRSLVDYWVKEDIGEAKAIAIAYRHLKQLIEAGMLNQQSFDPKDVQVGYGRIIQGSTDGKQKMEAITEYRITFRPNIDGIQLANSGVRIAVHRSGVLSAMRIGGVATDEISGSQVTRTVSVEDANRIFSKTQPDNAKTDIAWSRVMYVMPEDKQSAVVEPAQVFAYSLKMVSDGDEVISRRKTVGVSLGSGQLIDYTAPASQHEDQKMTRDETAL